MLASSSAGIGLAAIPVPAVAGSTASSGVDLLRGWSHDDEGIGAPDPADAAPVLKAPSPAVAGDEQSEPPPSVRSRAEESLPLLLPPPPTTPATAGTTKPRPISAVRKRSDVAVTVTPPIERQRSLSAPTSHQFLKNLGVAAHKAPPRGDDGDDRGTNGRAAKEPLPVGDTATEEAGSKHKHVHKHKHKHAPKSGSHDPGKGSLVHTRPQGMHGSLTPDMRRAPRRPAMVSACAMAMLWLQQTSQGLFVASFLSDSRSQQNVSLLAALGRALAG